MKHPLVLVIAVSLLLATEAVTHGQEEATQPWWRLGGAAEEAESEGIRESKMFSGPAISDMFKMPDWPSWKLPTWSATKSKPKQKNTTGFGSIRKTSKRWWNNTVDFINPFDSEPEAKPQGYRPQDLVEESSGGWSWFGSTKPKENPTTVTDFLKQPRPKF